MRRFIWLGVVLLFMIGIGSSAFGASDKTRVAVVDFNNNVTGPESSQVEAVRRAITDMFITELWKTQMFTIIERSRMEAIAREHKLAQSGLVDEATAVQLGKLLGVEAIITGSITQFTFKKRGGILPIPQLGGIGVAESEALVTLDVRMINVETGEIVLVAKETGQATHSAGGIAFGGLLYGQTEAEGILAAATRQCIEKIVKKIASMRARGGKMIFHVIKDEGDRVYIDAGESNAGATVGSYYAVYIEGEPIYGVKGELLGVEKVYIAILQVEEVYPQYSIAKVIKGRGVMRGDKLEPLFDASAVEKIKIRPRILGGASSAGQQGGVTPPPPSSSPSQTGQGTQAGQGGQTSPPPPPPPPPPQGDAILNTGTTIEVIERWPIDANLKNNLIRLHKAGYYNYSKGNYSLAIQNYKLAFELYNGNYVACYWLGRIYYEIGRKKDAIDWWKKGLSINPNYEPVKNKLKEVGAL